MDGKQQLEKGWAQLTSDAPDGADLGGHRVRLGTIGERTFASEAFRPVLVLGPQRSYKTSGFAVPTLLEWDGPALVTSVRRDVLDDTYKYRMKRGSISVFDPAGSVKGTPYERFRHSWDILDHCKTWDDCVRTANALTEARQLTSSLKSADGDFWGSLAAQLLAPHLFAASYGGLSMRKVVEWIKVQEEFEVRAVLQGAGDSKALRAAECAWERTDKIKDSVYTTAHSVLRVFDYDDVGVDDPPFVDLDGFLESSGDTLYLCAPPDEQEEYRDLFTGLVRTVVRLAYTRNNRAFDTVADRTAEDVASAAPSVEASVTPLLMLLDEAGNIAPLKNLTTLATTSAGTNVQMVTIFHDLSQMQDVYGLYPARSIVSNHSAFVLLPGARDEETLAYVQNLVSGERIANTVGGTWNGPKNIRGMERGTALLVYENLRPVVLKLRSRFNNETIRRRTLGE
ncbi:type IV secretory system conjugative DNA transfer family protein [Streptomyces sp. YS-B37]|uniref:type IV secretory system conjugative DNA transfer family protein n=1 Tax=Streptomyces sp. YS-B37 TaxID=3407669 RepID=UPI003B5010F3